MVTDAMPKTFPLRARPCRQYSFCNLDEALAAALAGNEGRSCGHRTFEIPYVRDAASVGEESEHRRIVRAIATKHDAVPRLVEIEAQPLAQENPGHGELAVAPKPSLDVDLRHLGDAARAFKQADDLVDGRAWQRRHVLAEVDRKVRL